MAFRAIIGMRNSIREETVETASPWSDLWSGFVSYEAPKQIRFNAKYLCRFCRETWKVKNTSKLRMICTNKDCRQTVGAYKFDPIDTLVVYGCPSCGTKVKHTRCEAEIHEDVPFCKICHTDMEIQLTKYLWKKKRKFGEFHCGNCNHGWKSGNAWEGYGQQCLKCKDMILPHRLSPLRPSMPISGDRAPHQEHLCDMCKKLGHNCRTYEPPPKDIADLDEIPLEEDLESRITTNSSKFGDDDDDTPVNSEDGDRRGADLTTIAELDQMIEDMNIK